MMSEIVALRSNYNRLMADLVDCKNKWDYQLIRADENRKATEDLRVLCIRIARAKDDDQRAHLIGHANRIAASVGITPQILREYTEESVQADGNQK